MELNKIYNMDCCDLMDMMSNNSIRPNVVLTSPPYNTSRKLAITERAIKNFESRYSEYEDFKSNEQYIEWTRNLFHLFDKILSENGVILYNMSYGSENPSVMWLTVADIIANTPFLVADCIVWKKGSALPNNTSPNKLTRICEYVFVICRKSEFTTYQSNKQIKSQSKSGQNYYYNTFNYIEAKNNDGSCDLNKATYSTDLCNQLLQLYARKGDLIYDPFMGTGTTAMSCVMSGINYIGSELCEDQCIYANNRISTYNGLLQEVIA